MSYGIIDKKIKIDNLTENDSDLDFLGKNMSTFSQSLNCYIVKSTNIKAPATAIMNCEKYLA